jgi:hypothetical protein
MTKVTIKRNEFDEYEVPTAFRFIPGRGPGRGEVPIESAIYFTSDRDDAIATAQAAFLPETIVVLIKRGTYVK